MIEITDKIYYVGVNDRNKELFEGLWPLPNGVSYNSYLIDDEKVCLIDTVEVDFFMPYLKNIREILGDRQIDYLVINHMEPDHSGAIELIRKYYPGVKIVANKKTFGMIDGFYGITTDEVEVKNGSKLSLGHHELTFVLTPMVHWPETMVTLDTTTNTLFSGDAFGCFGALNGGIIDSEINCDTFWLEMVRYYSNIVGKYGTPVQNALKKLEGVQLDYICSTHGPVWHEHISKVIGIYDRLSRYETEEGIVICYGTMYGNTERMAEVIARAASQAGIKNIVKMLSRKINEVETEAQIYRYEADEFVLIFRGKNQKEAFDRVETIRRAIASSSFGIRGINKPLKLTVSGAVTEQKRSDGSAIEVLLRADKALQKSYRFAQNITTKA